MPRTLEEAKETAESSYEHFVLNNLYQAIERNVDIAKPDIFGRDLLSEAIEQSLFTVAAVLIENDALMLGSTADYRYPHNIFKIGAKELLKAYKENVPEQFLNEKNLYGAFTSICYDYKEEESTLHNTKIQNILDVFKFDLNNFGKDGNSVIFVAICLEYPSLVKLLLENGVSKTAVNKGGLSPLAYAEKLLEDAVINRQQDLPRIEKIVQMLRKN